MDIQFTSYLVIFFTSQGQGTKQLQQVFRFRFPVRAVRLSVEGKGEVVTIPPGTVVRLRGTSQIPGFVEVLHEEAALSLFLEDLQNRAERIPEKAES
jgi:hypothetical protein